MGLFNFNKKSKPAKEGWPTRPPKHTEDTNYLLNEYEAFGLYQFLAKKMNKEGEVLFIDMFSVILMENGYGSRYANILKNGVLLTIPEKTKQIRDTKEWKTIIGPWLEGDSDYFPAQDGIIAAELAYELHEINKEIEKKKNSSNN